MADYYTNFSFVLKLKDSAESEYVLDIAQIANAHRFEQEQLPATFPEQLQEHLEDWRFEVEREEEGIWFHSTEGGIDAVCAFVQHLIQKFQILGPIAFEWSFDCSKPRTDAYGGGAAIITAQEIKCMTTSDWVADQTRQFALPHVNAGLPQT